jgi:hypothetical protein
MDFTDDFSLVRENLECLRETAEEFPNIPSRDELCKLSEEFLSYEPKIARDEMTPKDWEWLKNTSGKLSELTKAVANEFVEEGRAMFLGQLLRALSLDGFNCGSQKEVRPT